MDSQPGRPQPAPCCPHCGGRLFQEVERIRVATIVYPKCLNCGREYYRSGSFYLGAVAETRQPVGASVGR
jgi:uncharacterized protein (DUF983 family)